MSKQDYSRRHLSTDSYATDDWIQALFPLSIRPSDAIAHTHWFDPCPLDNNPVTDGLAIQWYTPTFVNPPYSNPLPWVKKAIYEHMINGHTVVMLLKHDSSTQWYKLLHEAGAKFLMIQGRLKYGTNHGAAFPSILAVLA